MKAQHCTASIGLSFEAERVMFNKSFMRSHSTVTGSLAADDKAAAVNTVSVLPSI